MEYIILFIVTRVFKFLQVGLADVIDMYYEDLYTLPNKELSCGFVRNFTNLPNKKVFGCKFLFFSLLLFLFGKVDS